jgi:hypothetical protein
MADFIPRTDAEFNVWFTNFQLYTAAHAAELGLSPDQALEIQTFKAAWGLAYTGHIAAQDAAMNAKAMKDQRRDEGEKVIRRYAGFIQNRPETTDAQRRSLGITVPDREPTPTDPEAVKRLRPPSLFGDFSVERQVDLHFGVNPRDEHRNAKPHPAAGARIWRCEGALPAGATPQEIDALPWVHAADHTNSPWLDAIGRAGTFSYRAQWYDHLGNLGPLGDPVTCAVTG